jgi:hypothetical protein
MWKNKNSNIKYENTQNTNQAGLYVSTLLQNQSNMVNASLYTDIQTALKGGCQYIPELICKRNDLTLFKKLEEELKLNVKDIVNWSKHHKYENPEGLQIFDEIVKKLCEHFNIKPLHVRLNYYLPKDWKPFHHDSHAYSNDDKEDITIGASFGESRELEFIHDETKIKFKFPQNNGDVFVFNNDINKKFMHGIPKDHKCKGNRISIIVWGKNNAK